MLKVLFLALLSKPYSNITMTKTQRLVTIYQCQFLAEALNLKAYIPTRGYYQDRILALTLDFLHRRATAKQIVDAKIAARCKLQKKFGKATI